MSRRVAIWPFLKLFASNQMFSPFSAVCPYLNFEENSIFFEKSEPKFIFMTF